MSAQVLTHRSDGSGPDLLLLNGIMMSIAAWDPVAAVLATKYRVIRCDLRGQLLSPGVAPAAMSGHAQDLIELLDHLGVRDVHVAGTSFGAMAGVLLAAGQPERVRSLTAITATDRVTDGMWMATEQVLRLARRAASGENTDAVFDAVVPATFSLAWQREQGEALNRRRAAVASLPSAWFAGLAGLMASIRGLDLRETLGEIRCPALVIGAGDDLMFPPEYSQAVAAGIAGAELVMLPGAPHGVVVERPEDVAELIDRFVGGVVMRQTVTDGP